MVVGVIGVPSPLVVPPVEMGLNLIPELVTAHHLLLEEQTAKEIVLKLNPAMSNNVVTQFSIIIYRNFEIFSSTNYFLHNYNVLIDHAMYKRKWKIGYTTTEWSG
jgi:hypothetical protein